MQGWLSNFAEMVEAAEGHKTIGQSRQGIDFRRPIRRVVAPEDFQPIGRFAIRILRLSWGIDEPVGQVKVHRIQAGGTAIGEIAALKGRRRWAKASRIFASVCFARSSSTSMRSSKICLASCSLESVATLHQESALAAIRW